MRLMAPLLLLFVLWSVPAPAQTMLLMAEEQGCLWCARWDREIAAIYPKTPEGRAAPLLRFDVHRDPPAGVRLAGRILYTPTFVLVRDGSEIGRIEGYPGEDFFWGLLGTLLARADIDLSGPGTTR